MPIPTLKSRLARPLSKRGGHAPTPTAEQAGPRKQDPKQVIGAELNGHLARRSQRIVLAVRSFLPRCFSYRAEPSGITLHRCSGCVVFSDASGFTKLTETLAQKSDGAEVLSKCLNKFFTPLIDIIEAYRGDVIKFSGDALSILFEATDDYSFSEHPCGSPDTPRKTALQLACLRASACCLEIHKRLHNFDTGEGGVRLALHIGVGAGDITMLQVGGELGRFEYVITGPPLEQISIAEPLASSGETVLSPQTWREVEDKVVEGDPLDDGRGFHRLVGLDTSKYTYPTIKQAALECRRIDISRSFALEDAALLRLSERFIPHCVIKHLRSGNYTSINEIRSVTIVFLQIGGVDVGTEAGSRGAQDLMVAMQRVCYKHEGTLNKFLVDDKGILFLFVFGLPPCVHIDDPERAIMSCFGMIEVLEGMSLVGRFGVTTGRVFCGIIGSDRRREYTVMGDTVNLSARLMANAPENAILIDEATFKRSRHKVSCERLEPIMVKGKAKPVKTFSPVVPRVHDLELQALAPHLSQVGWDHDTTDLDVSCCAGRPFRLPWRARSQFYGGSSPLVKLERWRELRKLNTHLKHPGDLLRAGGSLTLLGPSGIGKQEISEHIVFNAIQNGLTPLFGMMRRRKEDAYKACAQLVQNCVKAIAFHRSRTGTVFELDRVGTQVMREIAQKHPHLEGAVAFLGFGDLEPRSTPVDLALLDALAEVAVALVKETAESVGVVVVLRLRRGTDIFDGLAGTSHNAYLFWRLATNLAKLGLQRKTDIIKSKDFNLKPILAVTVARNMPEVGSVEDKAFVGIPKALNLPEHLRTAEDTSADHIGPWRLQMCPLTADATVELMCHCLNLETTGAGILIKRSLREFTFAVSIGIPAYAQECLEHLRKSGCIEVTDGECLIRQDPSTMNIAEWVHTSMVGGTITQLENLGPAKGHIIKLATVFEGPFSAWDLAAANRALFGRVPRILALHDQVKLLTACKELAIAGYLKTCTVPLGEFAPDRGPGLLPRWTVSNSLLRKVAGSMLLQSQKILIKRAVLISRALYFQFQSARTCDLVKVASINKRAPSKATSASPTFDSTPTTIPSVDEKRSSSKAPVHVEAIPEKPSQDEEVEETNEDAFDQLLDACAHDSTDDAAVLLIASPHLLNKASEPNGHTPLHVASSAGSAAVVRLLCKEGADVTMITTNSETAVLLAAHGGHLEVVQHLCEECDALAACSLDDIDFWERSFQRLASDGARQDEGQEARFWERSADEGRQEVLAWLRMQLRERSVHSRRSESDSVESTNEESMTRKSSIPKRLSLGASSVHSVRSSLLFDFSIWRRITVSKVARRDRERRSESKSSAADDIVAFDPSVGRRGFIPYRHGKHHLRRSSVRTWLRSKTVLMVMLVCLALALYTPDVLVSAGIPGNLANDLILSVVMMFFLMELCCLCVVERSYPFSFFFWMDCIGTVSLVLDLTYLLAQPDELRTQQSMEQDLTFFRATRTAKVAARAGRLSRLVKLTRFLPGLGHKKGQADTEQLRYIQNQLTNSLSMRIACLTILLVVFLPLLTIGLYPDRDLGTSVWTEQLSRSAAQVADPTELSNLLRMYSDIYQGQPYGPYKVCFRDSVGGHAAGSCHALNNAFSQPGRLSFQLDVSYEGTIASFDFSGPTKTEANLGIMLISIIIVLMCGACMLLNYAASELAVRPLEHMFSSIKGSADAIFSVSAMEVEDSDEEGGEEGNEELDLLERVIRKISVLVEVSTKNNLFGKDEFHNMNEDLGALGLSTSVKEPPRQRTESVIEVLSDEKQNVTLTMQWQLEETGVAFELLDSWNFNILEVADQNHRPLSVWLLFNYPGSSAFTEQNVDLEVLRRFVNAVAKGYTDNEYHNFAHAVDVTHCMFRYLTLMGRNNFSQAEQFSLLVAGISHDVGHIGVNNSFLVETNHELAICYNDRSPLENMHCYRLFEHLASPDTNVLSNVPSDQYRELRKMMIRVILHTDISLHQAMVKELEILYDMNSKVFAEAKNDKEQVLALLGSAENKMLVAKLLVHGADLSNPTKPFPIARAWAMRVLDECALQGDRERDLGIPVLMLNDRVKLNRPNSQIGFVEFIVAPLMAVKVKIIPALHSSCTQLASNVQRWEQIWIEESNPGEAEREKVKYGVRKMCQMLEMSVVGFA